MKPLAPRAVAPLLFALALLGCSSSPAQGTGGAGGQSSNASGSGSSSTSSTSSSSTGMGGASASSSSGAGGHGGLGGMGGAGGAGGCEQATDCFGVDDDCQQRTCVNHICGTTYTADGTPVKKQTKGDCKQVVCDGAGMTKTTNDDTDLPVDVNACTDDVCMNGVPSNPPSKQGTSCGKALFCDGSGNCIGCQMPGDCPGPDDECKTRTCSAKGVCGFNFTAAGTPVKMQTAGDCQSNQCDGAGLVKSVADNTDVPVDNKQCTADVCTNGAPSNPPLAVGKPCNENGGSECDGKGTCVQCVAPTDCPGQDTDCHTRTCMMGVCGVANAPAGKPTSMQTPGDCKQNQCDGNGGTMIAVDDTDLPVDGNQCTQDVCMNGVASNPPSAQGAACNMGGGTLCNGAGQCVQCVLASTCPGVDTACQTRTCTAGVCGFAFQPFGTAIPAQTPGDCQVIECDGAGSTMSVADNSDVPADDGNQCTSEVCTNGVPAHPARPVGTSCNQGGGTLCDVNAVCDVPPFVTSTTPADGGGVVAGNAISVTFSQAMDPTTLTGQTSEGPCTGSVQVSIDGFATCEGFSSSSAVMSNGNKTATFTPAPGLLVNRAYKIRVASTATSAVGLAMSALYVQTTGFTTSTPNLCDGSLVVSQVYGGGGNVGATYKSDFIEIHNRGSATVNLAGLSVQYASATGTSWAPIALSGSIPPGGFYLVQGFTGASGAALPAPDATSNVNLSAINGKVALVVGTAALPAGICPPAASTIDFVGYGTTANCFEGAAAAPVLSSTTSGSRIQTACADVNNNSVDYASGAPNPRNSQAAASVCACSVNNESGLAAEADYCDLQFPLSTSVQTGTTSPAIYGRVYEGGQTGTGAANPSIRAQLGFGPLTQNPEYETGWQWTNATFNLSTMNNDEYQTTFVAPAVGSYGYVYRFSLDQGVSWTYCDQNAGDFGAGSNPGLTFDLKYEGALTVTP